MAGVVDDTLSELLHYAAKVGVELTGIAPRRLPGRGYGIVAMRDIEVCCTSFLVQPFFALTSPRKERRC